MKRSDGKPNAKRPRVKPPHPLMVGRDRNVWHPDVAGKIRGYPLTEAKWQARRDGMRQRNAEGKMGRSGIPDGWAGKREEINALRAKASAEAKEIVKKMAEDGVINPGEDPRGEEALEFAISVVRAIDEKGKALYTIRDRLAANRQVLDFAKGKPSTKIEATVAKAEDFLAILAAK